MGITIINKPEGVVSIFTAGETITASRTLRISDNKIVSEMSSGYTEYRQGVSLHGAVSGAPIRVKTLGIVSGVVLASGGVIPGAALQAECASGFSSGTGLAAPLLSGVGTLLGNAINSGGRGSGIAVMVLQG